MRGARRGGVGHAAGRAKLFVEQSATHAAGPNPDVATWRSARREQRTIDLNLHVDAGGTINHCANVNTAEGLTAQDSRRLR